MFKFLSCKIQKLFSLYALQHTYKKMYLDTSEYLNETVLFIRVFLQLPVMCLRTYAVHYHIVRYYIAVIHITFPMYYYCLLFVRACLQFH